MNITQLKVGECGRVVSVTCEKALSERLSSLSVRAGAEVRLLKVSFFKKTFLIGAGSSQIALRKEVAECVSIQKA